MVLTFLGGLHDWICDLPIVEKKPIRSWFSLCFDPSYWLMHTLEDEYERLYELANRRCMRAAISGDESRIEKANAWRVAVRGRYHNYQRMKVQIGMAAEKSNYWRDCADCFGLSIAKPRDTEWSVAQMMLPNARPDCVDTFGRTSLHNATYWLDLEQCSALLRAGVEPTTPDHHGNTPLHYLCMAYRTKSDASKDKVREVFSLLINHGADPDAANIDGRTPRQIAPNAPYFQHLRQRERLERLARKNRRRSNEAPARRAM